MKKIDLKAIKTRPHLIAKFPHLFQPGGGFPHLDQILDLTLLKNYFWRYLCAGNGNHSTVTVNDLLLD